MTNLFSNTETTYEFSLATTVDARYKLTFFHTKAEKGFAKTELAQLLQDLDAPNMPTARTDIVEISHP